MFLRRSLASLARAYKLLVYDFFFMSVHLGGLPPSPPPPPPPIPKSWLRYCCQLSLTRRVAKWRWPIPSPPLATRNRRHWSLHITNPLINAIQCARNFVFIHKFSKNLPTVGGGETPLPHPPPSRSLRSLALAPLTNPAFTTITGIAKMHKGRGVDPGGGGGQGGSRPPPNENIGGQTYRLPPPPPNNFSNLKKS